MVCSGIPGHTSQRVACNFISLNLFVMLSISSNLNWTPFSLDLLSNDPWGVSNLKRKNCANQAASILLGLVDFLPCTVDERLPTYKCNVGHVHTCTHYGYTYTNLWIRAWPSSLLDCCCWWSSTCLRIASSLKKERILAWNMSYCSCSMFWWTDCWFSYVDHRINSYSNKSKAVPYQSASVDGSFLDLLCKSQIPSCEKLIDQPCSSLWMKHLK
jgi:hypothetical protein